MDKRNTKFGYVAGMATSAALLANDLVIFGNLNLNTVSIVMLVSVFSICLLGYVKSSKKDKEQNDCA
ncbi:hypothetical protein [Paraglaciecola hydrolytica]|uniref:Uncharacterized protein n=1 Tax=Paraglaciecola hydrolytica TaxID=1799789 RepID=A0A148KLL6_9ALTE|nr:hypothetical protein [Paraglaciecola hydrolytica]KXI27213.1 hypothetical protein AX660_01200 [Paraglaciecola hydrolytica]